MSVKDKSILPNCKIVIIRISGGEISYTTPCEMCKKLLNKYKIKKICSVYNDKVINCCEKCD
jgi:hypothetical protein